MHNNNVVIEIIKPNDKIGRVYKKTKLGEKIEFKMRQLSSNGPLLLL